MIPAKDSVQTRPVAILRGLGRVDDQGPTAFDHVEDLIGDAALAHGEDGGPVDGGVPDLVLSENLDPPSALLQDANRRIEDQSIVVGVLAR
jgi:hypothetical protein